MGRKRKNRSETKNSAKQPRDVVLIVTTQKKDYRNDPDLITVSEYQDKKLLLRLNDLFFCHL